MASSLMIKPAFAFLDIKYSIIYNILTVFALLMEYG